jgi:hypothetical protein
MAPKMIHYKPGLTMDAPIAVTMAAADWVAFMTWLASTDTTGVNEIAFKLIGEQVGEAVYDQASIKAAMAARDDVPDFTSLLGGKIQVNFEGIAERAGPTLDDLMENARYVIRCRACGSTDEYPNGYQEDGASELTCGHDGGRTVEKILPADNE